MLLSPQARSALPPLYSQEDAVDPMIYARLSDASSGWACYVAEGAFCGDDFVVYGFFLGRSKTWGQWSVAELEEALRKCGLSIKEEDYAEPTPLSTLVPGISRRRRPALKLK